MTTSDTKAIDTVGLSAKERRAMIDAMESSKKRTNKNEVRRGLRVPFNIGTIVVAVTHPNGNTCRYAVAPRNLSTRGLAFLHGRYIYSSSPVQVFLPTLDRQWMRINGAVLHCRHVNGIIHEVSVLFDKPTDIRQFVDLNADEITLARKELGGRALVVQEVKVEREALSQHLQEAGMAVTPVAEGTTAAVELSRQSYGVVIVDISEEAGVKLVRSMRESEFAGIIVGLGNTDNAESSAKAVEVGCNCYLPKPVRPEMLHQVIDQLLHADNSVPPENMIQSTMSRDEKIKAMIPTFLQDLGQSVSRIHAALRNEEYENITKQTSLIKSGANTYGFPALAEHAKQVLESLVTKPLDKEKVKSTVDALAEISRRVYAPKPQPK